MPDTTPTLPADELRAAATLLREVASHATPGPWRTHDTWLDHGAHTATVLTDRPNINDLVAWLPTMSNAPWDEARNAWRNAAWMATSHPGVGLALADWLDRAAVNAAVLTWPNDLVEGALAVARQVLGTTDQQPETTPEFELRGDTEIRAAALREAADAIERMQHDRDDVVNDALGGLDRITEAQHTAVHRAAAVLRRLADEAQQPETEAAADTLPAWLHQRFTPEARAANWDSLSDDDRAHWEHHAKAVRRAVTRNGFKPAADQPDTETEAAK